MTTYTPGPWRVGDHEYGGDFLTIEADGRKEDGIATLNYQGGNAEADARLMAAAPDAVVLAEWLLRDEAAERDEWDAVDRVLPTARHLAEAFLAKATGA